ncbi:MAG: LLM class flavin-dependent oxidoreductase [Micromonosporaceae bacterium]|nr:LLM class flavin-dependent oxidoreductase [Micromonosporaceae bacterium]
MTQPGPDPGGTTGLALRCGLRLPPHGPFPELVEQAQQAERWGFDSLWLPDSHLLWHDVWTSMAVLAANTSRVTLGTAVANPVTRHPTVLASAAASVDALSGGRTVLGVGAGDSAVRILSGTPARVDQMRAAVETIRTLTGGHRQPGPPPYRIRTAQGRPAPVPVYLGVTGPRMLRLAGELADGAILMSGAGDESIRYALSHLREGLARAGRRPEELDVVVGLRCFLGDPEQMREQARPFAAKYLLRSPDAVAAAGVQQVPRDYRELAETYPDLVHSEDWEAAVRACRWVPHEVLEQFCAAFIVGPDTGAIRRTLHRLHRHGVSHVMLMDYASYAYPSGLAAAVARDVLPSLAAG